MAVNMMKFPETVEEFMEQYKITDTEEVYTNGADLVPIFRMEQWFEHLRGQNGDYISREAAIALLKKWADGYDYIETPTDDAINKFYAIPAANVRPVVRGEWEWDENGMDWNIGAWRCSRCGSRPATFWNTIHDNPFKFAGSKFCDNCGADMTGRREADEEDEP